VELRLAALLAWLARLPPSRAREEAESIVIDCLLELDEERAEAERGHPTSSGVFRIL